MLPGRAQYYYGDDLRDVVAARSASRRRKRWRYSEPTCRCWASCSKPPWARAISAYLPTKLWKPLGMESPALWALDRQGGSEKAFLLRQRAGARLRPLRPPPSRRRPRTARRSSPRDGRTRVRSPGVRTLDRYTHRHLWWFPEGNEGDYYAYGHNGQYVYVNPAARTVIAEWSAETTPPRTAWAMFRASLLAVHPKAESRIAELELGSPHAQPVASR
jgi:hypothetical protein